MHFHSGEGPDTLVKGFTIQGGFMVGTVGQMGLYGVLTPEPYETTGGRK